VGGGGGEGGGGGGETGTRSIPGALDGMGVSVTVADAVALAADGRRLGGGTEREEGWL
jgi:hypothetical protein